MKLPPIRKTNFDRRKPPTNLANRARRQANKNTPAGKKARLERLAVAGGFLPWDGKKGLSQDEKMAKRRGLKARGLTAAQFNELTISDRKKVVHGELRKMGLKPPKIAGKVYKSSEDKRKTPLRRENQSGGYLNQPRRRSIAAKKGVATRRKNAARRRRR